ncbi:MAG TPA: GtrA family protein [Candidatus Saccharimonadales bacterium]|nr:GtrA family protein [Candidatus Saccharimonadales bacterium]
MQEKVKNLYTKNEQLARYFIMAAIIVSIEYLSYLGMLWLGLNYLVAVPLSMGLAIILNWHFSRVFVFKNRRHSPRKEFMLVLATSLVGVGWQLGTTFLVVQAINSPAAGKFIAIIVTFFWNYIIRKKYIF